MTLSPTQPQAVSEEKLKEIEARAEKATEGWRVVSVRNPAYGMMDHKLVDSAGLPLTNPPFATFLLADAAFIAHARTDIPALAEALRLAWAEIERLRGEVAAAIKQQGFREEEAKNSAQNARTSLKRESAAMNMVSKLEGEVGRLTKENARLLELVNVASEYRQSATEALVVVRGALKRWENREAQPASAMEGYEEP